MGLLNHVPELANYPGRDSSCYGERLIVRNLLKRDLPIDTKDWVQAIWLRNRPHVALCDGR